jgi:hypothetical protein
MPSYICPLELLDIAPAGVHCLVKVQVAGVELNLVLDTGASRTVIHEALLRQLIGDEALRLSEEPSTAVGISTLQSHLANVMEIYIGSLRINDAEIVAIDLQNIIDSYEFMDLPAVGGILGGDLLLKYNAVIDYGSQSLTLSDEGLSA